MKLLDQDASLREGRDEMNLADFPISALQRAQKGDGQGGKLDRLEFTATRYDPVSRQRVTQKVTLTSTARDGLPTPADEHVILALLYVAKHSTDFTDATVAFAPSQLFTIMGWAPNGRSYTRLRDVLRRLKALTIRYENAWWDAAGRGYQEEVATGIISGYRLARQVSGPRTPGTTLESWVTWTQQFHDSLKAGNLKRLDLETFFRLSTPTAQRMYRFLDKRFYNTDTVSMDLVEFACGHVGLAEVDNLAILKRRLSAAIEELEAIGFIEKAEMADRYQKVKAGQWRVTFRRPPHPPTPSPTQGRGGVTARSASEAAANAARSASEAGLVLECRDLSPLSLSLSPAPPSANPLSSDASLHASQREKKSGDESPHSRESESEDGVSSSAPPLELARHFYHLWDANTPAMPGPRDLEQVALLLKERDADETRAVLACLVQVTRKQWPQCRSLSGAVQKYLGDALKMRQAEVRRASVQAEAERLREQMRQEETNRQSASQRLQDRWSALTESQREAITARVRHRLGASAPAAFMHRLCLEELGRTMTDS